MIQSPNAIAVRKTIIRVPSSLVEYSFFGLLWYQMLGAGFGVVVPFLGSGALFVLAALCVISFGPRTIDVYKPIALALGCAVSVILVQLVVHNESILDNLMRSFVSWFLTLIVVQALFLRKGFFQRFALMAFLIGCATLPFVRVQEVTDEYVRMGAGGGVGLANPNALAMWFGFCMVYFIIAGLENQNVRVRVGAWAAGALCFFVVALTVSRGPLLGAALASVFAFQKVLKRSFVPILMLILFVWILFMSGVFDVLIGYYTVRGDEESGRSHLWSVGLNRFLNSWVAGVGLSDVRIEMFDSAKRVTPHNGLLFIGLSSGVIPLMFFVGFLIRAVRGAFRARSERMPDSPFTFPLVIVALQAMMVGDATFMYTWPLVVLSMAVAAGRVPQVRRKVINKSPNSLRQSRERSDILGKSQPYSYRLT